MRVLHPTNQPSLVSHLEMPQFSGHFFAFSGLPGAAVDAICCSVVADWKHHVYLIPGATSLFLGYFLCLAGELLLLSGCGSNAREKC